MRALGRNQLFWLGSMADHPKGVWYPRCGYVWSGDRASELLCESLVKRGLVRKADDRPTYEITAEGRALVEARRNK